MKRFISFIHLELLWLWDFDLYGNTGKQSHVEKFLVIEYDMLMSLWYVSAVFHMKKITKELRSSMNFSLFFSCHKFYFPAINKNEIWPWLVQRMSILWRFLHICVGFLNIRHTIGNTERFIRNIIKTIHILKIIKQKLLNCL